MYTVGIEVFPYIVAQGGQEVNTRVNSKVAFTRFQVVGSGAAIASIGITVYSVIPTCVCSGAYIGCRKCKFYGVVTRYQAREQIVSTPIGNISCDNGVAGIQQTNGYTTYTWFATILYPVGIFIQPNQIAQFGQFVQTCVYGLI